MNFQKGIWTSLFCTLLLSACSNYLSRLSSGLTPSPSGTPSSTPSSSSRYTIASVDVYKSSSVDAPEVLVRTDTTGSMVNTVCQGSGSTTKSCYCKFTWQEINQTGPSSVTIDREVQTPVTSIGNFQLKCAGPNQYYKEIASGTLLKITVIPGSDNRNNFSFTTKNYIKNVSASAGSFEDIKGRRFENILRYTCYHTINRRNEITNAYEEATNSTTNETYKYPIATSLCIQGQSGGSGKCNPGSPVDISSQSYYYNLFTRESELGSLVPDNSSFVCPKVAEALVSTDGVTQYWPLDSAFALSLSPTADFPVGVVANIKLSKLGDINSYSNDCFSGSTKAASDSSSLLASCLGFAARANADGTCGYITDASGARRPTFRLRRFIALYPSIFDIDGKIMHTSAFSDTIYVLDRPITNPADADPTKPFAMMGPKPCPFAYFDKTGVTGAIQYVSTNSSLWDNKNIDGIEFPNKDSPQSCAMPLALLNSTRDKVFITTLHQSNPTAAYQRMFVRAVKPWSPNYIEDETFQACAPQSSVVRDPPLHVAQLAGGHYAWCAEVYPTQNNNIGDLETWLPAGGPYTVQPFTSHHHYVGAACTATLAPWLTLNAAKYPAGVALHNVGASDGVTCDRTAILTEKGWGRFPLLATQGRVEEALRDGKGYRCNVTADQYRGKAGKIAPTGGCCLNTTFFVGPDSGINAAHFEPNPNPLSSTALTCGVPAY